MMALDLLFKLYYVLDVNVSKNTNLFFLFLRKLFKILKYQM